MLTLQAKVTSKGQITLSKPLRSKLGIKAGDRLEFLLEPHNRVSLSKKMTPGASTGCGKRFVASIQGAATLQKMDEGIRQAVVRRFCLNAPKA